MAMMGFREYARHRKVTLRAVQKAIEAGRIATVGEGRDRKIDSDQADRDWVANTDPAAQSLLYSAGPADRPAAAGLVDQPATPPAATDDDEPEPPAAAISPEYRAARAKREQTRAEREQLELDQLRGSLIPLADAEVLVFTSFRALRDAALQTAARVKDRCAATSDAFMVEQIIEAEIAAAFARFDPSKMLTTADAEDEEEAAHAAG